MHKLRAATVALVIAGVTSVPALGDAPVRERAPQASRPSSTAAHMYQLGNVSIHIPPPRGFEEMLSRSEEFRRRIGEPERLWNLAAHLPNEAAKNFKADQDISLYTKVSVSRAAVETDITDGFFAGVVKQQSDTAIYDQDFLKKYMADRAKQLGVTMDKPVELGVIEQTPKSYSTLALTVVSTGDRQINLLFSTSLLHLHRRLIFAYVYRIIESQKDQALVETLTRDWVRSILAANP
jgi:hypothetical protein